MRRTSAVHADNDLMDERVMKPHQCTGMSPMGWRGGGDNNSPDGRRLALLRCASPATGTATITFTQLYPHPHPLEREFQFEVVQ